VQRRLGPALHLVRLPSGDTVFLASARKFKKNARIKGLYVLERQRPKPDAAKGDLVDELEDQPRTFSEITRQEARQLEDRRAPALAELRRLESRNDELARGVAADLARLDMLTRDVNAVIGPMLLPQGTPPAPQSLVRKVKRLSHSYSREQYYRYALPVTGLPKVDATLAAYLEQRGAEELVIMGLATDYCVRATVLDACGLGFGVTVIEEGCRGVDVAPGDSERAFTEMRLAGARVIPAAEYV